MLLRLARASRHSSNQFILLELTSSVSGGSFGPGTRCEDSLLLESLVDTFLLPMEAMGSGLFLFRNYSINVAPVSPRDSIVWCWACIAVDCSCWTRACSVSCQAFPSGALAMWELASFLSEDDVDWESAMAACGWVTPSPRATAA